VLDLWDRVPAGWAEAGEYAGFRSRVPAGSNDSLLRAFSHWWINRGHVSSEEQANEGAFA
jgi:hypothetical protein